MNGGRTHHDGGGGNGGAGMPEMSIMGAEAGLGGNAIGVVAVIGGILIVVAFWLGFWAHAQISRRRVDEISVVGRRSLIEQ